jgi:hypothetical protein
LLGFRSPPCFKSTLRRSLFFSTKPSLFCRTRAFLFFRSFLTSGGLFLFGLPARCGFLSLSLGFLFRLTPGFRFRALSLFFVRAPASLCFGA